MTGERGAISIRRAEAGDAAVIGAVIGAAFADDPINCWVFGKGAMAPTFTALARHLYLRRGYVHLAQNAAGEAVGAALWLTDARLKEANLWRTLRVASVIARTAGLGAMQRGLAIDKAFTAAHPAEQHGFLFAIGVVPQAQGKGVGGALLRAGLEPVDALGLPCYLESTKAQNVPVYRHFGFDELPAVTLPEGCPPIWPMWRAARN